MSLCYKTKLRADTLPPFLYLRFGDITSLFPRFNPFHIFDWAPLHDDYHDASPGTFVFSP